MRRIDVHHVELLAAELESSMRDKPSCPISPGRSAICLSGGWPSLAFARTSAPASPNDDAERAARDRGRAHELPLLTGPDRVDLQPMGLSRGGGSRASGIARASPDKVDRARRFQIIRVPTTLDRRRLDLSWKPLPNMRLQTKANQATLALVVINRLRRK
jgi:hypothetical protein